MGQKASKGSPVDRSTEEGPLDRALFVLAGSVAGNLEVEKVLEVAV